MNSENLKKLREILALIIFRSTRKPKEISFFGRQVKKESLSGNHLGEMVDQDGILNVQSCPTTP